MSKAAELEKLQLQQQIEWALLRTHVTTLARSVEEKAAPAEWVCKHPYIATASAAAAGFAAAQVLPALLHRKKKPEPEPAPPPRAAGTHHADLIAILAGVAQQLFHPPEESDPATLSVGDAGAVVGSDFPAPDLPAE